MRKRLLSATAAFALLSGWGGLAHAQKIEEVRVGPPGVAGRLDWTDPKLESDNSSYELWRFAAVGGKTYEIRMSSSDFDAYLALGSDVMAEPLAQDDDGGGGTDARIRWRAPNDGVFQIRANSVSAGEEGAYLLTIDEAAPSPAPQRGQVRVGQPVRGSLDRGDAFLEDDESRYDLWSFQTRQGRRYEISMRSSVFDTFLAVGAMGADGELEVTRTNDDAGGGTDSRLVVAASRDGTMWIRANALNAEGSGPYTLEVRELPARRGVPAPARAVVGGEVSGSLGDDSLIDDEDGRPFELLSFDAQEGRRYRVTMASETLDSYLTVGDMDRASLTMADDAISDDDNGGELNARVMFVAPRTGAFTIRAGTVGTETTGAYTVSIADLGPAPKAVARDIAVGQTVNGRLEAADPALSEDGTFYDLYAFEARAGQRYAIEMNSLDFDTFLMVGAPGDGDVAQEGSKSNDDFGDGSNSRVVFTATEGGTRWIRANALSAEDSEGAYALTVTELPPVQWPAPRAVSVGQTLDGTLTTEDPALEDDSFADEYVLRGRRGQTVTIDMKSEAFDSFLSIGTGTGTGFQQSATDDDSGGGLNARVNHTFASDGTLTIRANSLGGGATGAYQISVTTGN